MPTFRPATAHGPVEELFPDVFFVRGTLRLGPGFVLTRNMVVVRQGGELTLVNSVRLTEAGEAELEKLGKVRHLVRLGFAHGADDPYYVQRFAPTFWAPRGQEHAAGLRPDEELRPSSSPLERSQVFLFENGMKSEAALILDAQGGVLLPCDSYQNWTTFAGCSALGGLVARALGMGPTIVGGPWAKIMGPSVKKDFDALLDRDFRHLLPAHGEPLRDRAKEGLYVAVGQRFPV